MNLSWSFIHTSAQPEPRSKCSSHRCSGATASSDFTAFCSRIAFVASFGFVGSRSEPKPNQHVPAVSRPATLVDPRMLWCQSKSWQRPMMAHPKLTVFSHLALEATAPRGDSNDLRIPRACRTVQHQLARASDTVRTRRNESRTFTRPSTHPLTEVDPKSMHGMSDPRNQLRKRSG